MGSLMSGWSSTVLGDEKRVRLMRNRSLTREDVDAFWRQRGRPDSSSGQSSPLASPRRPPSADVDVESSLQQHQQIISSPSFEARRQLDAIRSSLPSPLARGGAGWSLSSSHYDHDDGYHHQHQRFYARSEPSSPAAAAAPARRVVGFPGTDGSSVAAAPDSPSSSSTSRDWWTVSSWAFLNETPYDDEQQLQHQEEVVSVGRPPAHKAYDACEQFHVARIVTGNA